MGEQYHYLVGAEDAKRAADTMEGAAEMFGRHVNNLQSVLEEHVRRIKLKYEGFTMSRKMLRKNKEGLYSVCVPLFASTIVCVRANSPKDALEKASTLCHQCSDECEMGEVDIDNLNLDCVTEIEDIAVEIINHV